MNTYEDFSYESLDKELQELHAELQEVANQIYRAHLPPYLQQSWSSGKGKWYEDWLREQLDILIMSEICDDPVRSAELEEMNDYVALLFGIFGAASRILDHIGMHLRGQTLGQYEVLPEDEALLRDLCQRFLQLEQPDLDPFFLVGLDEEDP